MAARLPLVRRLLICAALLLTLTCAAVLPARADTLADIVNLFAADSFGETEEAIQKLVTSNHPKAQALLEALGDRRLLVDTRAKVLAYKIGEQTLSASDDTLLATFPSDALTVRLNNRLRRVLETALGNFTLSSPDPARRIAAVDGLAKARDVAALPRLEEAMAREGDARVKIAMEYARASLILGDPSAKSGDRIAAISIVATRTDADAMARLRAAAQSDSADVATAGRAALQSVEQRRQIREFAQNVWYGLSLGSVLLLAAAGLAITFGVMGVINMAHGEMVMIGAYTTFVVQQTLRAIAPGLADLNVIVAIPAAFVVAGAIGMAIERGIIRFLYGRPLETLLATWGVSLILQQAVRSWFGASNVKVATPSYMNGSFEAFGLQINYGRMWIVIFTLLAFVALQIFIRRSALGLQMRAVTQNRRMASAMGIRTGRVDALTFGLGSGIAGVAGVALSQIDNVAPNLGQSYIIDCFMVVVFGGVGNLLGTLVSAFSLGVANKLLEPVIGAVLGKIVILVLLILFIQKRPRGLFALRGRAVEA